MDSTWFSLSNDGIVLFLGPFFNTLLIFVSQILYWMNFLMFYYLIEQKYHKVLKNGPKIKDIISFVRRDNVESENVIKNEIWYF